MSLHHGSSERWCHNILELLSSVSWGPHCEPGAISHLIWVNCSISAYQCCLSKKTSAKKSAEASLQHKETEYASVFPVFRPALDHKRGPGSNASTVCQACLSYTPVVQPHNMDSLHQDLITALEENNLNGARTMNKIGAQLHTSDDAILPTILAGVLNTCSRTHCWASASCANNKKMPIATATTTQHFRTAVIAFNCCVSYTARSLNRCLLN